MLVARNGTIHYLHIFHAAATDVSEQAGIIAVLLLEVYTTDGKTATVEASSERMLLCSDGSPSVAVQVEVGPQRNGLVLEVRTFVDHVGKLCQVLFIVDVEADS